jgi:hypothetical protein
MKKERRMHYYIPQLGCNNMVSPKDSAIERNAIKLTATGHANPCSNYPANVLS